MFHLPETGLYLTHYRLYDPNTGRWLNRDPIGEAGGLNLYAYVGGNPVNFVDPTGEFAFFPALVWGAQAAWGAYQGYRASQSFQKAQCTNPPLDEDMNNGDGPTPGQNSARNVRTFGNLANAYGWSAAVAIGGVGMGGVLGHGWNLFPSIFGFGVGAYVGLQQPCTCPAQ
jgi:RHS repeat-associated protein